MSAVVVGVGWGVGVTLLVIALALMALGILSYPNAKVSGAPRRRWRDVLRHRWYRWRHPRCTRSGECLLDDGHTGECDEEPYT